jgi:16S rRNA (guanine966-N2)-methyltransferase
MKILTGDLRGRIIFHKPNPHLRPTSDKTRKAIFDMLQGQLENKTALDLFSGTGALGFEALSQGADLVTFVEIERSQASVIKNNLMKLGLSKKSEVIIGDTIRTIEKLSRDRKEFDFIFLDPPYEKGLGEKALAALLKSTIVKKETLIILECRNTEALPNTEENFVCLKNKIYGDTRIVIYRRT